MKVLVLSGGYLPGYRYGGPVRSLAAFVEHLGDEIDIAIVTGDHDLGDSTPYPNLECEAWVRVGKAKVWYTTYERPRIGFWRRRLMDCNPDLIYLNSFFNLTSMAIVLWTWMKILPAVPILLAPRGEFSKGALRLKSVKKKAYIHIARRLGVLSQIYWHATSEFEKADILEVMPDAQRIHIAPNLLSSYGDVSGRVEKTPGQVKLVYVARVSPKKNLLGALQLLLRQEGKIIFDLYGPLEDKEYWERCLVQASQLPDHIEFAYRGELAHHQVAETLKGYHFMFLPTLGENFGHSIAEALQQGCPVLISDQTPWRDLEDAGVGWDLSLEDHLKWSRVLKMCVGMDDITYQRMSARSRGFAEAWVAAQGGHEATIRMFRTVAGFRV